MTRPSLLPIFTGALTAGITAATFAVFLVWPSERIGQWLPTNGGIASFFVPAILASVVSLAIARLVPPRYKWTAWLPPLLLLVFAWGAGAIAGMLVQLGASTLLGFAVLTTVTRILFPSSSGLQPGAGLVLISLGTGLALFSGALWVSYWFPVNSGSSHLVVYIATALLAWRGIGPENRRLFRLSTLLSARATQKAPPLFLVPALAAFLTLALISMLPELGSDARAAYQGYFEHLRAHGYWHQAPWRAAWGLQPLGGLHLAGSAYLMGGEAGARALNCIQSLIYAATAGAIAHAVFRSRLAGWAAAAVVITTPVLLKLSGDFYYANAVALFVTAAMAALVLALRTRTAARAAPFLIAFGICLAGAAATKNSAWVMSVFLYALAVAGLVIRQRQALPALVLVTASTALAMTLLLVPVVAATYLSTGNPVFPYYNQIFQSEFYPPTQHQTPHQGYFSVDMLLRAVFDTERFSPQDPRGALGAGLLLVVPALAAMFVQRLRIWLLVLVVVLAALLALTGMQNDLRLLWPLFPALLAVATALVLALANDAGVARRAAGLSILALCGLQIVLLPTGSHQLGRNNLAQAVLGSARSDLVQFGATTTTINAMLDGLSPVPERRLYLSTLIGPSSGLNFEDGWYTVDARQSLHRARTADEMVAALQALAPDVVVLGTHPRRRWLYPDMYGVLQDHSWARFDFPGHQVFMLDNTLAFPVSATQTPALQEIVARSQSADGWRSDEVLRALFPVTRADAGQFRVRFDYACPVDANLQIVLGVRSDGTSPTYRHSMRPCMGEAQAGSVVMGEDLPSGENLQVTMSVQLAGSHAPFEIRNLDAGLKPRFTRQSYLDLD